MSGLNPYGNPYPKNSAELDLRIEFHKLLYGAPDEVPKGRKAIFRKMRRDSNGSLMRCPCRDILTDHPSKDHFCRTCWGHGYYWDEKIVTYFADDDSYKRKETDYKEYIGDLIYLEYNIDVTDEDYIVSIRTNFNGSVIIPIERLTLYKIYDAKPYRSDNGRIEFITLRTREEQKWSTWYGISNRQQ